MSGEPQNGSQHYDVIVVGLGAMGSAALYQLSKHDARVLGIDQFDPPHDRGSSHGETRLTRLGIGEGRHYVPFAIRSHEIWRELEAATGEKLLTVTGGLFFSGEEQGSPVHGAADFIGETVAAAQAFDIEHEVLDHQQLNERFPQFRYSGRERGYYEPDAGFVAPEKCIEVQLRCAQKMGAEVRTHEPVHRVEPLSDGTARVLTESGAYTAQRVILSAGSWLSRFLPPIHHDKFKVYRQSLYWIEVEGSIEEFHPERFPVFIRTDRLRDDVLYGFPANDGPHGGIKIATEYYDSTCNPEIGCTPVSAEEQRQMLEFSSRFLRVGARCIRATSCLFTVTPDGEFVIDHHPDHSQLILASPCSGHGFKHSAAVGELLAAMGLGLPCELDRSHFGMERFSEQPRSSASHSP